MNSDNRFVIRLTTPTINTYYFDNVPILDLPKEEKWDLEEFREYCMEHEDAFFIFINKDALDENRFIPNSKYDFKYFIDMISHSIHGNNKDYTFMSKRAFINGYRPVKCGDVLYDVNNNMQLITVDDVISDNITVSELALCPNRKIGNEHPMLPALTEYTLNNGRKFHWLEVTDAQFDRYILLSPEDIIYYENDNYVICKEDIDGVSVYRELGESLDEIPFD